MPDVGFGGVWPRSSSPVLGLLGLASGFVGSRREFGGADIRDAQYTVFFKFLVVILCDLCFPLYAHMLLLSCKL